MLSYYILTFFLIDLLFVLATGTRNVRRVWDDGHNQWAPGGTNNSDDDERGLTTSDGVGKGWKNGMLVCYYNKFLYSYFFLIESDDDERWAVTTSIRWWWWTSQNLSNLMMLNRRPCTVPAVQDASSNSSEFFCSFFIYLSNVLSGCRQRVHRLSTIPHQIQAAAPPRHHLRRCRPSLDVDADASRPKYVFFLSSLSLFS
jgi:hypothetical protein